MLKMKSKLILSFSIIFIFGFLIIIFDSSNDLVGIWEGSYIATQGKTGLSLSVYNADEHYEAIFDFYNLPGKTNAKDGKYYMYGYYNESTKKYNLIGYEWIKRPDNYVFVNLEGKIKGNIFSGSVIMAKYSFEINQNSYHKYYAKLSEETEVQFNIDEFTFRVVRKSENILRRLIQRIFL
jgi:hypothetical protein